ncbi:MAG TPA: hypothetical protein VGP06_15100 [Janthinobacterium sp.]|jgi:hypothetical protein|nr:hypothetical protein [Janthinobacterium sp.]
MNSLTPGNSQGNKPEICEDSQPGNLQSLQHPASDDGESGLEIGDPDFIETEVRRADGNLQSDLQLGGTAEKQGLGGKESGKKPAARSRQSAARIALDGQNEQNSDPGIRTGEGS